VAIDEKNHLSVDALLHLISGIEKCADSGCTDRELLHDARTLITYARAFIEAIDVQQGTVMTE
jgi:hypothetical protein